MGYFQDVPLNSYQDELAKWQNNTANQQDIKLKDMAIQQMPDELAYKRKNQDLALSRDAREEKSAQMKFSYEQHKATRDVSYQVDQKATAQLKAMGVDPNNLQDPRVQDVYNQVSKAYYPFMSQLLGKPIDPNQPADIQSIKSLAVSDPEHSKVNRQLIHTPQGVFSSNLATGETEPVQFNGQQLKDAQFDPYNKAALSAATEGQQGVEVTGPNGEKFRVPQWVANQNFKNFNGGQPPQRPPQTQPFEFDNPQKAYQDAIGAGNAEIADGIAKQYPQVLNNGAFDSRTPNQPPPLTQSASPEAQAAQGGIVGPTLAQQEKVRRESAIKEKEAAATIENNKKLELEQKEAQKELPKVLEQADYSLSLLDALKNHKGLSGSVGLPNISGALGGIRGTNEADFHSRLDQITGQNFLQAFESLKGGGQITEIEGKKASDAIARLNTAQTEPEFIKAVDELKSVISGIKNRAKRLAGGNAEEEKQPSVDDLLKLYGGK